MSNEILLILSVFIYFGCFILFYYLFGRIGLIIWNTIALVFANIEVVLLINAFGLTMTLGNVCFTSTSLVTDLLSEKFGAKETKRIAYVGFFTTFIFVIVSQLWLMYQPSPFDSGMPHFFAIFQTTPRIILAGLFVYVTTQLFDIKLFFKFWDYTKTIDPDPSKYLWLRNNGSTIIAQLYNAIMFNLIAFYNVFDSKELNNIIISTFVISVIGSLISTPFLYWARNIKTLNLLD